MRLKIQKPHRTSRSIAENFHRPFVGLYDPDSDDLDQIESVDNPDTIPMRLGKKGLASFKRRRFASGSECFYCRGEIPEYQRTVDHVTPESRGGPNHPANLVLCCPRCNRTKDNQTPREWLERLTRKAERLARLIASIADRIEDHGLDWFEPIGLPNGSV